MNKEVNANEAMYLISLFIMPIITLFGMVMLEQDMIGVSNVIDVGSTDLYHMFLNETVLFLVCWVGLFLSYIICKYNIKYAQFVIAIAALVFLVLNIKSSLDSFVSIADFLNPIVLLITCGYTIVVNTKNDLKNKPKKAKKKDKR